MSYLFLAHLGPVQDFIASARRSRDLAFGSWFLSEISREAAATLVKQNGWLIFPAPQQERLLEPYTREFNVANKIVAWIEKSPQDYGEKGLGDLISSAIAKRLDDIKKKAYMGIQLSPQRMEIAERQIKDLVEFFWVALPYDEKDVGSYAPVRLNLEALMAARKNTRNFQQMHGAYVPKSSITGQLESVIPEQEYPSNRESEQQKLSKIHQLYWKYGAGPAERLSGVDLLKRHGLHVWNVHFPGTGHIAALPFLQRLHLLDDQAQMQAANRWTNYIDKVKQVGNPRYMEKENILDEAAAHPVLGSYEGTMLFEERLVDLVGAAIIDQEKMKEAKDALQAFYSYTDSQFTRLGLGKASPDPYYALLQADGDGMGEIIDALARQGRERHRQLSQKLASFAGSVATIVNKYGGALVYSGGDDILAFLPLHTVLQCASELARQFRNSLREFAENDIPSPTLSIGIAIAHYLDSLREVRDLAREAERSAKQVKRKNALAITVSKRSGEDYSLAGRWGVADARLEEFISYYRQDAIPSGTPYELRDMLLRLTASIEIKNGEQIQFAEKLLEVMRWDALRILKRKLYVPRDKFSKEQAERIERSFKERLGIMDNPQEQSAQGAKQALTQREYQRSIRDFELFINELIIAQALADAREMAQPGEENKKV